MTVEELLNKISAKELSEWMAYEMATGPMRGYDQDMLAGIHEQLQTIAYILGEANSEEDANPIPMPSHVKRPNEVFKRDEDSDPDTYTNPADFDSQFD